MKSIEKNLTRHIGLTLHVLLFSFFLIFPSTTHSKNDESFKLGTSRSVLVPKEPIKEFTNITAFKTNPEFYKINTILTNSSKVHFKKPLEQDLYFLFGPYIKGKRGQEEKLNEEFNEVLGDLFKFHFN